jgi:tryptophan halogenase
MINICVVGGGFTGWMTAVILKKENPTVRVTLVDSPTESKREGIGESCPDNFLVWLLDHLRIPMEERSEWFRKFVLETNSMLKYGVRWKDWLGADTRDYLVPWTPNSAFHNLLNGGLVQFAKTGPDAYKQADIWYELFKQGRRQIEDFNIDLGDLYWTISQNRIPYYDGVFHNFQSYTCQINTTTVYEWFKKHYSNLIDEILPITVADVELTNSGSVRGIIDTEGVKRNFDLYIDCSGTKRIFTKYVDLDFRPGPNRVIHRSVAVTINGYQDEEDIRKEMVPYTFFNTMKNGWRWEIPLLDSKSFGYVFDQEFVSDDEAIAELTTRTGTDRRKMEPKVIRWEPGYCHRAWDKNVITVGLATGFIDPIDGNSIATQRLQIDHIVNALRNPTGLAKEREDYNNKVERMFSDICLRKDVTFCLAPRNDTPYWERNKTLYNKQDLLNRCAERFNNNEFYGRYPLFYDNAWLVYFIYYGNDASHRVRNSDPKLLDFADKFFVHKNIVGRARADLMPDQVTWLQDIGADFNKILL